MTESTSAQPRFKMCTKCGEIKLNDQFSLSRRGLYGTYSQCKVCKALYAQQRYHNNPELMRENARAARLKSPDAYKQHTRRYLDKHPDKRRETEQRYRLANPDKEKIKIHRRRARLLNLPNVFTAANWQRALDYFGGCCAYCGNPPGLFNPMILVVEHFVPLSNPNCPGTVPENIVPACKSCNSSKQDKPHQAWLVEKFGKRKASIILKRIEDYFASLSSTD